METIKTHKGIFDEKKKTARIMRNVFIVVAVVYVGLIIWSICRQNYVVAEIPPSSRDEGLRLLHGLETNLAASLQTPQEA